MTLTVITLRKKSLSAASTTSGGAAGSTIFASSVSGIDEMKLAASIRSVPRSVLTVTAVTRFPSRWTRSTPAPRRTSFPIRAMPSAIRSENRPKPLRGYMNSSIRLTTFPLEGTIASLTAVHSDMPFVRCVTQSPLNSSHG
jgi:hypothetical protein